MEKIIEKEKAEKDKEKGKKVTKDKEIEEIQMEVNTLSTIDFKLSYDDFILGKHLWDSQFRIIHYYYYLQI